MDATQIRALIAGYLNSDNQAKQRLGRCFAVELGLEAGSLGPDGGVDGSGYNENQQKIYFQCKLRGKPLPQSDADEFYQKITETDADIGIILAGVGYKRTFIPRRSQYPEIDRAIVHYLTLEDILTESDSFKSALKDLPRLSDLSEIIDFYEKPKNQNPKN